MGGQADWCRHPKDGEPLNGRPRSWTIHRPPRTADPFLSYAVPAVPGRGSGQWPEGHASQRQQLVSRGTSRRVLKCYADNTRRGPQQARYSAEGHASRRQQLVSQGTSRRVLKCYADNTTRSPRQARCWGRALVALHVLSLGASTGCFACPSSLSFLPAIRPTLLIVLKEELRVDHLEAEPATDVLVILLHDRPQHTPSRWTFGFRAPRPRRNPPLSTCGQDERPVRDGFSPFTPSSPALRRDPVAGRRPRLER